MDEAYMRKMQGINVVMAQELPQLFYISNCLRRLCLYLFPLPLHLA